MNSMNSLNKNVQYAQNSSSESSQINNSLNKLNIANNNPEAGNKLPKIHSQNDLTSMNFNDFISKSGDIYKSCNNICIFFFKFLRFLFL